jgi:predicted dehydrogenase
MAERILRLGIVGFGHLVRNYYVPLLRGLSSVSVAVVVDPSEASRKAARAAFPGIPIQADPDTLAALGLDGLIVASPPSTHLAFWNIAAKAGIPVLLEKPFALRGEFQYAAAAEGERGLLMLDLNRRFWPPYQSMRESLKAGMLGELQAVDIRLHVDIRPWCSVTSHRLQAREGGVLYDLGSHAVDLARWMVGGELRKVSASRARQQHEPEHLLVELEFGGGVRARCDLAYTERSGERLALIGRQGKLELLNPNMAVHLTRAGQAEYSLPAYARDLAVLCYRGFRRSQSMMRYTVGAALEAFAESILSGVPFSPGFEDAAANAILLDAAASALESGTAVELRVPSRNTDVV